VAAGYYFFRSKRLAARGSIPGWRLDPSGWLLFFSPAAMLRLDARRNLCCFDTARLDTKRLDARWLLIIFFWLLRYSKRLDPAAPGCLIPRPTSLLLPGGRRLTALLLFFSVLPLAA